MGPTQLVARRVAAVERAMAPFVEAMILSPYARRPRDRAVADFMAGNPQEPTLPGVVEALTRYSVPQSLDWFQYKGPDAQAQAVAAASLAERLGIDFEPQDVFLTRGASGGISLALNTLLDPDDEVIFVSPPWFFYEAMIFAAGAVPVRVRVDPATFDLDVDGIARAVTDRTRAIVVNTPHNPTGRIYPAATLARLGEVLADASRRHGRPIFVVSDESYSRILFDGRTFVTPARFYPYTLVVHTYSKSALAPGQRLGYLAFPPSLPERDDLRRALFATTMASGASLPDAVMQYALPDIDRLSIDLDHLQRKRDRMVAGLRAEGYELHVPEGTFYLLPRSPLPDDSEFVGMLARHDVYVLPGSVVEMPGYFRVSLTATDEMIDRALPVFGQVRRAVERAAA